MQRGDYSARDLSEVLKKCEINSCSSGERLYEGRCTARLDIQRPRPDERPSPICFVEPADLERYVCRCCFSHAEITWVSRHHRHQGREAPR